MASRNRGIFFYSYENREKSTTTILKKIATLHKLKVTKKMNIKLINEIAQASFEDTLTFPQIVGKLLNEGVESYHVDLVRSENRYYTPSGETHIETVPFTYSNAAGKFSANLVEDAIKSRQAGKIDYKQFLQQIMDAGTVYYIAYLSGKRVIYFGREGDFHVQNFPKNN